MGGEVSIQTETPRTWIAVAKHSLKPFLVPIMLMWLLAVIAGCWGSGNSLVIGYLINRLPEATHHDASILWWPAALVMLNFLVFDHFTSRSMGLIQSCVWMNSTRQRANAGRV